MPIKFCLSFVSVLISDATLEDDNVETGQEEGHSKKEMDRKVHSFLSV